MFTAPAAPGDGVGAIHSGISYVMVYTDLHGIHRLTWHTQTYMAYTDLHGIHRLTWHTQTYMAYTDLHGIHRLT